MQALLQYQGPLRHVDHSHRLEPRHGEVATGAKPFAQTLSVEEGQITRFYQGNTDSFWAKLTEDLQKNEGITLPLNTHDRQRVDEYLKGYYWDIYKLRYEAANTDRHRNAVRRFYKTFIIKASTASILDEDDIHGWTDNHDQGLYQLLEAVGVQWDHNGYGAGGLLNPRPAGTSYPLVHRKAYKPPRRPGPYSAAAQGQP